MMEIKVELRFIVPYLC